MGGAVSYTHLISCSGGKKESADAGLELTEDSVVYLLADNVTVSYTHLDVYKRQGQDGADGQNGSNGTDGTDGHNGSDGQDGANGEMCIRDRLYRHHRQTDSYHAPFAPAPCRGPIC